MSLRPMPLLDCSSPDEDPSVKAPKLSEHSTLIQMAAFTYFASVTSEHTKIVAPFRNCVRVAKGPVGND
jgi:hypothetical protein